MTKSRYDYETIHLRSFDSSRIKPMRFSVARLANELRAERITSDFRGLVAAGNSGHSVLVNHDQDGAEFDLIHIENVTGNMQQADLLQRTDRIGMDRANVDLTLFGHSASDVERLFDVVPEEWKLTALVLEALHKVGAERRIAKPTK